jgi:hypothetical protein
LVTHNTPPSVIDPLSRAWERTKQVLFRPFDIQKWLLLGFCAWLAYLGEGGGGGGNLGGQFAGDDVSRDIEDVWRWILDHLTLIVVLAAILLLLGIVSMWLSSRGKFMFLDGVVRDRAAVAEPWRRFRTLGNSLFGFRLVVALLFLAVFGTLATLMVRELLELGIVEGGFGPEDVLALFLWVAAFVPVVFVALLLTMTMNDFVVPIMWLRQVRVLAAWREVLAFLSANLWTFVLYVLVKFVLALAIGLIACIAICLTCCIVVLPYIGVVILLPLYVFRRCYPLEFLAQFGPDYAALAPAPASVP